MNTPQKRKYRINIIEEDRQRVVWHVQRLFVYNENEVYCDDYSGNEEGIK